MKMSWEPSDSAHASDSARNTVFRAGTYVEGMSEGTPISTECAVVWLSPEGKIYCFLNQAAKEKFLQAPRENLVRAQAYWDNPEVLKQIRRQQ